MELNKINSSMTNWGAEAANLNENFDKVSTAIEQVKNATIKCKGYFSSESALKLAIPTAAKGDKAYVGNNYPYQIWIWDGSSWGDSGSVGGEESVNLGNYHTKEYTDAKLSELGSEVKNANLEISNIQSLTLGKSSTTNIDFNVKPGTYRLCNINLKNGYNYCFTVKVIESNREYYMYLRDSEGGTLKGFTMPTSSVDGYFEYLPSTDYSNAYVDIYVYHATTGSIAIESTFEKALVDDIRILEEKVSDNKNDLENIKLVLPNTKESLPFTYKSGYIEKSGRVLLSSDFPNKLVVFDLENVNRINIRLTSAISSNYTDAVFTKNEDGSGYLSPLINEEAGVVTDINTVVQARYLYLYVGSRADFTVSKLTLSQEGAASKSDLEQLKSKIQDDVFALNNNIQAKIDSKVNKRLGENLFDKDSTEILYDSLLTSANKISQPDYAKNFMVTPYIPIEQGKPYIGNYSSGDKSIWLVVTDVNKNNVLLTINKESGAEYKFTAPESAAYVRMCIPTRLKDTFIFNEGTEVKTDAYYEDKPLYHSEFEPSLILPSIYPWSGKTIAMYGDSITELCGNTSVNGNSWGGYLIKALQSNGIVRGWGGTPLRHSIWDNSTTGTNKHWFNEFGEKVAVGTEGAIQCNPAGMCDWKRIITQFPETIKDTIDAVILMGGTNDFRYAEIGNVEYTTRDILPESTSKIDTDWFDSEYYTGGDFDVTSVQGAVCSAILKLQTWMPNAVIIVATQLSGYWLTQGENGTHQLVSDKSGLTEGEFALKIAESARYMSVPVIDINGLTGINQWNRINYISDNVHPYTDNGKKAMARVFIGEFNRIMPKF